MSANFWVSLVSALTLFGLSIAALQLYKSELVRDIRARLLRRKIVPMVQVMLPLIAKYQEADYSAASYSETNYTDAQSEEDYYLMRYRADLEVIFKQAKPLFDQERHTIAEFLSSLSALAFKSDQNKIVRSDVENSVLLGQRIVQELTEIGL